MAYSNIILDFTVVESADALSCLIKDSSTWDSESGNITSAVLQVYKNGFLIETVDLIVGLDKTLFNEYLGDGYELEASVISGEADDTFIDDYYSFVLTISNGVDDDKVKQVDIAFLAKNRFKSRKLPARITYPNYDYLKVRDFYLLKMYLDAAEEAASVAQLSKFNTLMGYINAIYEKYEINDLL